MPKGKKSNIKITLTNDDKNKKELVFSTKDGVNWLKMEIFTCLGDTVKELKVCFKITPAIEEKCLCRILACHKLAYSINSLRVENKKAYAEKLRIWFIERKIEFTSDKECLITMGTTTPAMVRLKSVTNFVLEAIVAALLNGLSEMKKTEEIEKNFKDWISETFSNEYTVQTIRDRRQKNRKE